MAIVPNVYVLILGQWFIVKWYISEVRLLDEYTQSLLRRRGWLDLWWVVIQRRVSQKQLLLSGQARASDLLAVRMVEAEEGQNGVGQPQPCDTPKGSLCTGKFSVER